MVIKTKTVVTVGAVFFAKGRLLSNSIPFYFPPLQHISCSSCCINPSHHLSKFFFAFLCILSLLSVFNQQFCLPFLRIKCPTYCSFLSCIVLRNVCFAFAISKTSKLVFLSRYDILNMRRKMHISKTWILSDSLKKESRCSK